VNTNEAAAVFEVLDEVSLGFLRPTIAVVVAHHDVVVGELGPERFHVVARLRRRRDVGDKAARLLQHLVEQGSRLLPLVIILPVDD
jgi:hypothetical protein